MGLSRAKILADATRIFKKIITLENPQQMQVDLKGLVQLSREWQLGFNEGKM